MPDVMASYYINDGHSDYRRFDTNHITGAERAWFVRHGDELVDTMATRTTWTEWRESSRSRRETLISRP